MAPSECKNSYTHLQFKEDGPLGFLTLDRSDRKNALNKRMLEELIDFLQTKRNQKTFHVLIIQGSGGFFSAGADLQWMREGLLQSQQQNELDARLFTTLYDLLFHFPKPVLTYVETGAYGGALGLVTCSDIVIAEESASFALPETSLGLIPATIAPYILYKMGPSFGKFFMLSGERISARQALHNGLVHTIIKQEEAYSTIRDMGLRLSQLAPRATAQTKQLINDLHPVMTNTALLNDLHQLIAMARKSTEGQEGVNAFMDNRTPKWKL
jgi:methylglutaconyl-CoA hydratase